jgi:FtsZ-binding cell division protein ZapB
MREQAEILRVRLHEEKIQTKGLRDTLEIMTREFEEANEKKNDLEEEVETLKMHKKDLEKKLAALINDTRDIKEKAKKEELAAQVKDI